MRAARKAIQRATEVEVTKTAANRHCTRWIVVDGVCDRRRALTFGFRGMKWALVSCFSFPYPPKLVLQGPVILTPQELAFSQTHSFAELFQPHPHKVRPVHTPSPPRCWDYFGLPTLCAHPFPSTPAFPGCWYYWGACNGGWKRGNVLRMECRLQGKMVSHLPFTLVVFEIQTHTHKHKHRQTHIGGEG